MEHDITESSSPRLAPVDPDSTDLSEAVALGRGGANALRLMLRNRPLYDVWRPLVRHLNNGRLNEQTRQIVILRVAVLRCNDYLWGNHTVAAAAAGLSERQIRATIVGAADPVWSVDEAVVLRATEELVTVADVSDTTWASLSQLLGDEEAVELMLLVGHFVMVGSLFKAAHVQLEPGLEPRVVKLENGG